jgi:UDP:flavonoid glycosyltransferase YjiC (YdhE family)
MEALARIGAGMVMRADRLNGDAIEEAVRNMLFCPEFSANARVVSEKIKKYNAFKGFTAFMEGLMDRPA